MRSRMHTDGGGGTISSTLSTTPTTSSTQKVRSRPCLVCFAHTSACTYPLHMCRAHERSLPHMHQCCRSAFPFLSTRPPSYGTGDTAPRTTTARPCTSALLKHQPPPLRSVACIVACIVACTAACRHLVPHPFVASARRVSSVPSRESACSF